VGGAGDDRLFGGNGTDTASYASETAGINANLSTGRVTGASAGTDTLSSIEYLIGTAFDDVLRGNAAINRLAGGAGNDSYYVDTAGDQVLEGAGRGNDTIYATVDYAVTAGQEIETLRAAGTAGLTLTANDHATRLIGGSGNDRLNGGSGNDTLIGLAGAD